MRFDIITLFPELFAPFLKSGVTRRAYESNQVEVRLWNPRDYAEGNYRRVDDRPFGGGPGMVMLAEPLAACLAVIRTDRAQTRDVAPLVLFSPIGEPLRHAAVQHWSDSAGAVLLCGRYEGIDQRFIDTHVDLQISLGDFVLSGGELAAMALIEARDLTKVYDTGGTVVHALRGVSLDIDEGEFVDVFTQSVDELAARTHLPAAALAGTFAVRPRTFSPT